MLTSTTAVTWLTNATIALKRLNPRAIFDNVFFFSFFPATSIYASWLINDFFHIWAVYMLLLQLKVISRIDTAMRYIFSLFCFFIYHNRLDHRLERIIIIKRSLKMKLSCVILFVSLNVANVFGQEEYCYANDGDKKQTKHYSTKTPYEVARGTDKKYFSVPSETYLIKKLWD